MRAAEIAAEGEAQTEVSMPGQLQMPLTPIFVILAALLCGAWAMFWWQRGRHRQVVEISPPMRSTHDVQKGAT